MCECPRGYYGPECKIFEIFRSKLNFTTNFGLNSTNKNQFSNRTDIFQLFEKYEESPQTFGLRNTQNYEMVAVICFLNCMVVMLGYCIIKCCEKKILEYSGEDEKNEKMTSEEEKKCILIEMNDM